jgi:TolA-binding protein
MRAEVCIPVKLKPSLTLLLLVGIIALIPRAVQGQAKPPSQLAPSMVGRVPYTMSDGSVNFLFEGSYALLIGVSRYTSGYPSLTLIDQDIDHIKGALEPHGFLVQTVSNPTQVELERAIADFIRKFGHNPNNRLLIFFAGHGETLSTGTGIQMGYIVPSDTPPLAKNRAGFMATAIPMERILEYAKTIESKHALFVFDSCFAGTLFEARGASPAIDALRSTPPTIISKATEPIRQFITAGSSQETVPAQSLFVSYFIKGLSGDADFNRDGFVTGTELGEYIRYNVESQSDGRYTPRHAAISDPRMNRGDFIFAVPGLEVAAVAPLKQGAPTPQSSPAPQAQESVKPSPAPQTPGNPTSAQRVPTPTKQRLEAKDLYDDAWKLKKSGDLKEAEGKFHGAVMLFPENAKYHIDYAWCLYDLKKIEEAEGEFRQAISLNPSRQEILGEAHFGLCITLEKQDDTDAAQAECQKALQLGGPKDEVKKALDRLKKH